MKIDFPYSHFPALEIPDRYHAQVFTLPDFRPRLTGSELVQHAIQMPIGSVRLSELAQGKKKVLIVVDDISRPTPIYEFLHDVLDELFRAGVKRECIEFIIALGTHRSMTRAELVSKLGEDVVTQYRIHDHHWDNPDCLEYVGNTEQGVPVWVNKLAIQADLVIGLGAIMPIEVCGFTGGGKILVPGISGQITVDEMHWTRIDVSSQDILGKADNPIRASIDALARKAGLDFIVNVILDAAGKIVGAVAGDMVEAHRAGCRIATQVFGVNITQEFDIVIADAFPFDIEFWQSNKALDTIGEVVKKNGVVILVSPCYEGLSQTHAAEIMEFGYLSVEQIKHLVNSGQLKHKVVGVHMYQVSSVAVEKATLILVSTGVKKDEAEQVGFLWAETAQKAFEKALEIVGQNPAISVLKGASRMLIMKNDA
jgi:nickel-dependent lactate racemase